MFGKTVTPSLKRLDLKPLGRPFLCSASLHDRITAKPLKSHQFDVFEFHYLHDGHLTWELEDGSRLDIHGGDVALIQPNTPHHSTENVDAPAVFAVFCVNPRPPSPSPPFLTAKEQASALRILRQAGNCVCHGVPGLDEVFRALHHEAWRLAQEDGNDFDRAPAAKAYLRNLLHRAFLCMLRSVAVAARKPHYSAVMRAVRHVDTHLADNPSLREMADAAGLSVGRLRTLFHAETGESPAKYVLRRRLDRAKILLRDSGHTVTAIAYDLGFSSGENFARSFRKYFNRSPAAWRQQARMAKREGAGRQPD